MAVWSRGNFTSPTTPAWAGRSDRGQPVKRLPAVVSEGAVGLSHLVDVLATLHRSAQTVGGIEDLVGETLNHGVLATLAAEGDEPTQCQGGGATRTDVDRNLVGRATDAAGANFEGRLDVVESLLQGQDRVGAGLLAALLERTVDDALSGGLLAVDQDLVDQLRDEDVAVHRVLDEWALCYWTFTWHGLLLLLDAVAGTCLLTVLDTLGIQSATDDLVANTREVLHTTTADEHHGVLLEVVTLTRDVCGDLNAGGQADTGDLTQSRVRLLRGGGVHAGAHATTLRGALQAGGRNLARLIVATLADQLLNSWHR